MSTIHMFYQTIIGFSRVKRNAYMYFCTQTCLSTYVLYIQSTLKHDTYIGECVVKKSMEVNFDALKVHIRKPMRIFAITNETLYDVILHVVYHFDSDVIQGYLGVCA